MGVPTINPNEQMREPIGPGCSIRLKGRIWHVVFTRTEHPRQKEKSLKTSNKAKASAQAWEMHRQYEQGRFDPWSEADASAGISEALAKYRREMPDSTNRKDNARLVERVCERAGVQLVATLTTEKITQFIYQPGLADSTRWSYHNKIGACINWLFEKGYWQKNPMAGVPKPVEPETIPRHYTEDEIERFLQYARNRYEEKKRHMHRGSPFPLWYIPCFELMAFCGMRPAELMRLDWGDISFPEDSPEGIGGIFVMGPTKNKVERVITMHPRAERVLRYMQDNFRNTSEDSEPVLKNHTGKGRISKAYLGRWFTRVQKYSKMDAIGLYGLRHTYAAWLRTRGTALHFIKEEYGHKDIKTTMKYGRLGTSERMKAMSEIVNRKV